MQPSKPISIAKVSDVTRPATKAARDAAKDARKALPGGVEFNEPGMAADGVRCAAQHPSFGDKVIVFANRALFDEFGKLPDSDEGGEAYLRKYYSGVAGVQILDALPEDWGKP